MHYVRNRCIPIFRPHVRIQSGVDGRMLELMRKCWAEDPEERPTFNEVRAFIRNIQKYVVICREDEIETKYYVYLHKNVHVFKNTQIVRK